MVHNDVDVWVRRKECGSILELVPVDVQVKREVVLGEEAKPADGYGVCTAFWRSQTASGFWYMALTKP